MMEEISKHIPSWLLDQIKENMKTLKHIVFHPRLLHSGYGFDTSSPPDYFGLPVHLFLKVKLSDVEEQADYYYNKYDDVKLYAFSYSHPVGLVNCMESTKGQENLWAIVRSIMHDEIDEFFNVWLGHLPFLDGQILTLSPKKIFNIKLSKIVVGFPEEKVESIKIEFIIPRENLLALFKIRQ